MLGVLMEHVLHNSQQLRLSIARRPFLGEVGQVTVLLQSVSHVTQGPDGSISTNSLGPGFSFL